MIPESYVVYDGELKKLGRRWNTWVSRYYILRSDGEFTCRRKKTDLAPRKILNVNGCIFSTTNEKGKKYCIQILKHNGEFLYLAAESGFLLQKWINAFKRAGCIKLTPLELSLRLNQKPKQDAGIIKQKELSRFDVIDVENWEVAHVLEWLDYIGIFEDEEILSKYKTIFENHGIDGRTLLVITTKQLMDIGITPIKHRQNLLSEIQKLRE